MLKAAEKEKKELSRIEDIHKPNIICNVYIYTDLYENIFLQVLQQTHTIQLVEVVLIISVYLCGYWSILSGVEYETGKAGLFSGLPQGQNVPCA